MPIRLNLFAEAQAAEDQRRRDPVKRAIVLGSLLVALMLIWSSSLQLRTMLAKKDLGKVQALINARTAEYQLVLNNQRKSIEISQKLAELSRLATNRFLNATLLNALQQTATEDVQLTRLKIDQSYAMTEEIKSRTNDDRIIPGKPATATERIVLTLEARDSSPNPGDQVNQFKQTLANHPYFQNALGKTNEVRVVKWNPLQSLPDGRPFIPFTIECRFPDKTR